MYIGLQKNQDTKVQYIPQILENIQQKIDFHYNKCDKNVMNIEFFECQTILFVIKNANTTVLTPNNFSIFLSNILFLIYKLQITTEHNQCVLADHVCY